MRPRMPTFGTFSRRTSFFPLGMMVSFGVASLRPMRPAFSLARLIWPSSPSFSASSSFAFLISFFSNSIASGTSILATRFASSASGGFGSVFPTAASAGWSSAPSTMAVPDGVCTMCGSRKRGRGMHSGGSTQRSSMRRSLPSAKTSLALSPRARSTSREATSATEHRRPPQRQLAAQLGARCST